MRVRLRGINSVTKRLAGGSTTTYWYAWKGGPRLSGEPGTPEFIACYNEAIASKVRPPQGVLFSLTHGYQASADFGNLANRTRIDYVKKIKLISSKFGNFPLSALTDRRTRGVFMAWRDQLAVKSRRQADYTWTVFARIRRGHESWFDHGKSLRERRAAISWITRGQNLDHRRRGWISQKRALTPSPAAIAGTVDGTAAGRSSAASLVSLRWETHPSAPI